MPVSPFVYRPAPGWAAAHEADGAMGQFAGPGISGSMPGSSPGETGRREEEYRAREKQAWEQGFREGASRERAETEASRRPAAQNDCSCARSVRAGTRVLFPSRGRRGGSTGSGDGPQDSAAGISTGPAAAERAGSGRARENGVDPECSPPRSSLADCRLGGIL